MFWFGETVVRLRAEKRADPYSGRDTRRVWDDPEHPPATLTIDRVGFDPGGSAEPVTADNEQRVITQPTIYDLTYADVAAGDRIRREFTGVTYEVDGDPAPWRNPYTGETPGQVIKLKIVEG